MTPVLYGIGVGPGDPELITVKAMNTLKKVKVIFAPKATEEYKSVAREIITPYLTKEHNVIELTMPMLNQQDVLIKSWQENARMIASYLQQGEDVAFITLGDVNLYSTFYYLYYELKTLIPHLKVEIIPGITSFAAAASRTQWCLADKNHPLIIIPMNKEIHLTEMLVNQSRAVLMKVGKYLPRIKQALKATGPWQGWIISYCGQANEKIHPLSELEEISALPYMTVILLAKE
ncbi:precorrin-2 C20-methyltransferase /cobalt-factor II C20-methyltransferase [Carboxydocella thermautotrophica]|nr:precorrin-2 C20-methyltransferase /cobalt-factor II C20-methyltransferase [Carboxydocella thermautotrophica]